MSVPEYQDTGPITIPESIAPTNLAGKSVIITGGASGLGRAYAQAFVDHGAFVTIADLNPGFGAKAVEELGAKNAQFLQTDVLNWDQLVQAFEAAIKNSPRQSLDVVIANAGIVGHDDIFTLEDPQAPPRKPNTKIVELNLTGLLYTVKLAFHYFRRQPAAAPYDRCLILKSSLAGYVDLPGSIQYNASKFGVRGVMRSLRRTAWREGWRVNLVAPWYIRTAALSQAVQDYLDGKGIGFALAEDSARAMLLIASDEKINGRALGVVSRQQNKLGVIDLDLDDYPAGNMYNDWQKIVLDTAGILVE
ncbi:hypothetical protein BDY17DRAFT_93651 [Neohortaea acidophila]|uniref:Short chain dehydrogenase/ reductase n=1 Tax=Neohortaea acidophila TaxID=245834 RepID=A0A6A6PYU0_9PEZI|nr:uncharacterized protein BDY17DRAFT_93651 [Neohortaea acidophila]KAF2484909.1 hypothetical protein BDY17DRAFT_93651 [Neohortaea acidophila]